MRPLKEIFESAWAARREYSRNHIPPGRLAATPEEAEMVRAATLREGFSFHYWNPVYLKRIVSKDKQSPKWLNISFEWRR